VGTIFGAEVQTHHGVHLEMHSIPADDPLVYDMLCEACVVTSQFLS
jgi:hypothetical protein